MRLIRSAAVKKREDGKHMKKVMSLVLAIVMVALVGIVPGALADGKKEERYFFWEVGPMMKALIFLPPIQSIESNTAAFLPVIPTSL